MKKILLVLLVFVSLQSIDSLTCLQCNNVPSPKHCTTVTECFAGEVCVVERIRSEFGSELFNIGCIAYDKCSSAAGSQRCVECCNTTLCNAGGCGETGYSSNRGPVCYSCPVHSEAKPCHTIDFCGVGETCFFEAKQEFGELVYTTKCLNAHACREEMFTSNVLVGRDLDTGAIQSDSDRRSIVESVCRSCCEEDVCNIGCNTSMIAPTPATLCIPNSCEHGRCYDVDQDFVCVCDHGYEGKTCNLSTTLPSRCTLNPCQHGKCFDVADGFVCVCDHGYEGRLCNISIYACSSNPCVHGQCVNMNDSYKCICDNNFGGTNCNMSLGSDCYDIFHKNNNTKNGIYIVTLWESHKQIPVFCDMETDGGGWTVFQSRFNGSIDFYQNFRSYEYGFGSLDGEFWLGLVYVKEMASQAKTELRLDLTAGDGKYGYEVFQNFYLGAKPEYTLHIDKGTGTAGDNSYGLSFHNSNPFSTYDHDVKGCVQDDRGGWWYNNCAYVNLNGQYVTPGTVANHRSGERGMIYIDFEEYRSLKGTRMKFRRV